MDKQNAAETPETFGPYTAVRQIGDTYYISGQVGVDPDTKAAGVGIIEQVTQALKNIGSVLRSVGLNYDDVVKTTLYLTDMSAFAMVNDSYVQYFNEPRPARTTVGVAELPRVAGSTKLLFELDAVAARGGS